MFFFRELRHASGCPDSLNFIGAKSFGAFPWAEDGGRTNRYSRLCPGRGQINCPLGSPWAAPIPWVGTPGTKKEPPPVKVCGSFMPRGQTPITIEIQHVAGSASLVPNAKHAPAFNGNIHPSFNQRSGASIKGFIQYASGNIELRPANPNYKSIYIAAGDIGSEEFRIMGKVVRWVDDGIPWNVV